MTAQQPQQESLLDIRERPNGNIVIKRYPFETVFNSDEVKELEDYFRSRPHTPAAEYPDRHEAYLEGLRDARLNCDRAARASTLAARKDMAQELLDWIEKEYNFPIEYDDWLLAQIYNHLESLRQREG
jgi:hypothetical protein